MKINFSIKRINFGENKGDNRWEVMTAKSGEEYFEYDKSLFKAVIKSLKWRKAYE